MGSFTFDLKHEKKTLEVMIEGMFTPQNAGDFITEYQKNITGIKTAEFALVFDATQLKVSTQEVLPMLESCVQLYKQTGFNKIIMNMGSSSIVKNQINRVIKKVGLLNCEVL
jgi:hypothetical protein